MIDLAYKFINIASGVTYLGVWVLITYLFLRFFVETVWFTLGHDFGDKHRLSIWVCFIGFVMILIGLFLEGKA